MDIAQRRALRAALVSGDGAKIVAALASVDVESCPQFIGDALALAIAQNTDGAHQLAARCATVLRERSWDGDAELATQLDAAASIATLSTLTAIRVDLDEVAELLESGSGDEGWINLLTGETWAADVLVNYVEVIDDEPDFDDINEWLPVPPAGGNAGYGDMEHFIENITDAQVADRLSIAINGKGAFRRFKEVLQRSTDLEDDWYTFSAERRRGRARAWLAEAGFSAEAR